MKTIFRDYCSGGIDCVKVFLAAIILLIIIGYAVIIWLVNFEDNPPAEIRDIKIVDGISEPGGTVSFWLSFCKFTTTVPDVSMAWADEVVYPVANPPDAPGAEPGCYEQPFQVDVPATLVPSLYTLRVTLIYRVNPLAVRNVSYETPQFTIVEGQ